MDIVTTKSMNSRYVFSSALVVVLSGAMVLLSSCSELKSDLPEASTGALTVHPNGWATPATANFHGDAIRQTNWDMRGCRTCHGNTYNGGTAKVSCRTCHTDVLGPEHCNVCHGSTANSAPPRDLSRNTDKSFRGVGEHQVHVLGTARAAAASCTDCHLYPSGTIYDTLHLDTATPNKAEVVLSGGLAARATSGVTPNPVYLEPSGSCSNTYCHGQFKNGNGTNPMFWNGGAVLSAACGSCHGDITKPTQAEQALPKTSAQGGTHPNNLNCASCHSDVVNASLNFVNPSKHINGMLNVFGTERDF